MTTATTNEPTGGDVTRDLLAMTNQAIQVYLAQTAQRHRAGAALEPVFLASFGGDLEDIGTELVDGVVAACAAAGEAVPDRQADRFLSRLAIGMLESPRLQYVCLLRAVAFAIDGDDWVGINAYAFSRLGYDLEKNWRLRTRPRAVRIVDGKILGHRELSDEDARACFGDAMTRLVANRKAPLDAADARLMARLAPVVKRLAVHHAGGGDLRRQLFARQAMLRDLIDRQLKVTPGVLLIYGDVAYDFGSLLDTTYDTVWRRHAAEWADRCAMEAALFFDLAATFVTKVAARRPPDGVVFMLPVEDLRPVWRLHGNAATPRGMVTVGRDTDGKAVYLASADPGAHDDTRVRLPEALSGLFKVPFGRYRSREHRFSINSVVEEALMHLDDFAGLYEGIAGRGLKIFNPLEMPTAIH